jgi:ABC-type branched-subunit amino acid transport system substrate-binding protein
MAGALALGATACGRSGGDGAKGEDDTPSKTTAGSGDGGGSRIAKGEFGDLGKVCQAGDGGGTGTGLTANSINVGTITNKGAEVRPGLNQEMYDTAKAFVAWCNENGGINGRKLTLKDLDAKLNEYPQRVAEACRDTFALVGGGAIFDNDTSNSRVGCGLINIPGFVVSPTARVADKQVQPLPNPVYRFPVQAYKRLHELHPDVKKYGILWVDLEGVNTVRKQLKEALTKAGYEVAYDATYQPIGETGWRGFIQSMKDKGVDAFELVGEPENMTAMLNAMSTEGWYPKIITMQPNMYEDKFAKEAKAAADDASIYVRLTFPMFDMDGKDAPGMGDYLELMKKYNPSGKYPALLGAQGLSAWLLFAKAATECGSNLTRDCVIEKAKATKDWTAGGLHAPSQPGNTQANECGILVRFTKDGFRYAKDETDPNDGIYNCSPDNVIKLTDDYGVPEPKD